MKHAAITIEAIENDAGELVKFMYRGRLYECQPMSDAGVREFLIEITQTKSN